MEPRQDDQQPDGRAGGRTARRGLRWAGVTVCMLAIVCAAIWWLRERDPTTAVELGRIVKPGGAKGFNVVIVSMDTTRRDRLGCYGYGKGRTPTIDGLVSHGVRFDHAVTSSPLTLPSHTTMLTGRYPPVHGVRGNGLYALAPEQDTLAETLHANGYATAAFIGSFVLDERFGLHQGFDTYDFQVDLEGFNESQPDLNERSADKVTDAALRWLDEKERDRSKSPLFMWVHYFDPHQPYRSHGSATVGLEPYDAEIAFVDAQLARLLGGVDQHLGLDRTLVVLVTDHGESLGDHQEESHGFFIYGATTNIALILSCPGLFDRAYRVDDRLVGMVDVRPTIEELLGVSANASCDGRSLVSAPPDLARTIYIETLYGYHGAGWSPLFGLQRLQDKYILAPTPEYYDLQDDPGEGENLYASRPAGLRPLEAKLRELQASWGAAAAELSPSRSMTDDEIRRLSAIGYVHSEVDAGAETRPDPKDMLPVYNKCLEAMKLHMQGRGGESVALLQEALENDNGLIPARQMLAGIYVEQGRHDEAIGLLREAIRTKPDFEILVQLADLLVDIGRHGEAEEALEAAEALRPDDGRAPLIRGKSLASQRRYREAVAEYQRAIAIDEHRVGIPAREQIMQLARLIRPEG